jgi:hypothetical protein
MFEHKCLNGPFKAAENGNPILLGGRDAAKFLLLATSLSHLGVL